MIYKKIIRPLLFRIRPDDPEVMHDWTIKTLRILNHLPYGDPVLRSLTAPHHPSLQQQLWGLQFSNPVGLAAGYDKNAAVISALSALGFGFVHVGTITAHAQAGNPRPRIFRLPADEALINRMGFNNLGADLIARHLERARIPAIPVGVSIGKSKITPLEKSVEDYLYSLQQLYRYADYFIINVSSPNTEHLRRLQGRSYLEQLLGELVRRADALAQTYGNPRRKPLLLKIAPDLSPAELADIVDVVENAQLDGLVAVNTTITRPSLVSASAESGGLSGQSLKKRALHVVRALYQQTQGRIPIIGVGGIASAQDAYDMLRVGASLVKIYSGFVYEGPGIVRVINQGLARLLERDGIRRISDIPRDELPVASPRIFSSFTSTPMHHTRDVARRVLQETGAIITDTHVVYTSGRHGSTYINKDAVYPHTQKASLLGQLMAWNFIDQDIDTVVAPAIGGVILEHWTAHHLSLLSGRNVCGVFAEKEMTETQLARPEGPLQFVYETGNFVFKRGYDRFVRGKKVLVVEDVLTTGGSAQKVIDLVKKSGGTVLGLGVISNRGGLQPAQMGVSLIHSLVEMDFESWNAEDCTLCRDKIPVNTEIGKGKEFLAGKK